MKNGHLIELEIGIDVSFVIDDWQQIDGYFIPS